MREPPFCEQTLFLKILGIKFLAQVLEKYYIWAQIGKYEVNR